MQAQSLDFWFAGPRSVQPGGRAIVATGPSVDVSAFAHKARATLENVPPNARGYIITNVAWSKDTAEIDLPTSFGFKINTSPNTPQGSYTVILRIDATEAGTGKPVQRRFNFSFRIRPPASPVTRSPNAVPYSKPIEGLQQWKDNMMFYGKRLVDRGYIGCCEDYSAAWYYDGGRVFLQAYDYTGYQPFLDFAYRIHRAYRDHMLSGGSNKLYAIFPQGLVSFYERFGEGRAREALRVMQGDYPGYGPQYHWGAGWRNSRPEAYGLSLHLAKERVGFPRLQGPSNQGYEPGETFFDQCLANVMGQMEQWFVSETARYVYPFMVGLNAEALIEYYEITQDPEVPYLLKLAADKMYLNPLTWHEGSESMMIVEEKNGQVTRGPAPDLNLMIAPLYAWVCQHTGESKYCDIGDRIFASGVRQAYLDDGKHFSQNYRWSFKYLEWRMSAKVDGQATPTPAPTLSISANPSSIQSGQGSTLSWSSSNASSCAAAGAWSGSKPVSGNQGVQPASNATYTLTCTGSGGSVTRSATVSVSTVSQPTDDPPEDPPANPDGTPAIQLSSSASTVQPGSLVTLSWASSNATSCYAWGGWTGARAVRGSESVQVNSDTRYTLGCSGPSGGTSQTLRVTVSSNAPASPSTPVPSLNLVASPTSIQQGQTTTLSWASSNASSCVASGSWGGSKLVSGNQVMQPAGNSSYTLTCSGTGGSVTRTVSVAVTASAPPPAPTLSISASPPSIQQGQSTVVSWLSSNATSCSASGSWGGSKSTSGSQTMQPSSNATYSLTCTGAGGSITRSASVSVSTNSAPPPSSDGTLSVSLSASSTTVSSGGSTTLSWSSQNATACIASGGWSGVKAASGNQTVRPAQTTLYILGCSGPSGGVSRVVQVVVK